MATRSKAEVIAFRRGASIEDEEEIPAGVRKCRGDPRKPSKSCLPKADVDLTGKPKAWFLIGPNGSGKTALARWMGWNLTCTDRQAHVGGA